MRQLAWVGAGKAAWREAPDPELDGGADALVRPLVVASCDLDVLTVRGYAPLPPPFAVGHECVAEVLEVGDEVQAVRPGDLVVVPFQISCGTCGACRRGRTDSCDSVPPVSMYGLGPLSGLDGGGFLADAVRVPYADAMLLPVPDGVDLMSVASCSDNVVDGWRCIAPYVSELEAESLSDRRALVLGGGAIGLYAAGVGSALGLQVDYVDTAERRLEIAERLGARPMDARAQPAGAGSYPITVSARPSADGVRTAIGATWPGGVCTDAGIHFEDDVSLPMLQMYTRGLRLVTGRATARADLPSVLELVRQKLLRPELVTTQTVAWDDAADAWPQMAGKTVYVRPPAEGRAG